MPYSFAFLSFCCGKFHSTFKMWFFPTHILQAKSLEEIDVLSFILAIRKAANADMQQLLVEEQLQKRGGDRNTKNIVEVPAPRR